MFTKRAIPTILATSALLLGLSIGFHIAGAQASPHLQKDMFISSEMDASWPNPEYIIKASTVSGGDYQLTSLTCHTSIITSGGDYRLQSLTSSGPWGNCCCSFLPIVNN